ncbi:MAG: hypothetical protein GX616_27590 [Planctomycetes bacterium]|nr:hypothetical protein [Planctomycetota bacterium]
MITAQTITRIGEIVTVTVTSSLSGTVYYHWYLDGQWYGVSTIGERTFYLAAGEQARLAVVDTTDADFDYEAGNPEPYPARRILWWVRSLSTDLDYYRIDARKDGGDWSVVATVPRDGEAWDYQWTTGRLDDLTAYQWRVVPVDLAGNDGDPVATDAETIVRHPDGITFTVALEETGEITFTES